MVRKAVFSFFTIIWLSSQALAANESAYELAVKNTALHTSGLEPTELETIEGSHVRMAVFTTYDGYKTSDKTLGATVWSTVEPDLKNLCSKHIAHARGKVSRQQLNLWIAELLGLPAENADKRRFVILDVPVIQAFYGTPSSTIGIFRPCTDPRIGPHHDGTPICPQTMNPQDALISSDYKTWFINNSIAAYTPNKGAPWTEYGYTYNWNSMADNVYGVAEFVVLKNTPITVVANPNDSSTAYIDAEDYCK